MTIRLRIVLSIFCLQMSIHTNAQQSDSSSLYNKLYFAPDKLFGIINKKSTWLEEKIERQSQKSLQKLAKREKRLMKKLARIDSVAANQLFGNIDSSYANLDTHITDAPLNGVQKFYGGHQDSMRTALNFLQSNNILSQSASTQQQLKHVLGKYSELQNRFTQAKDVGSALRDRQEFLKSKLESFGLTKEYRKFQQQVYYYRAQMDEYRQMWEDPRKLEAKLMQVVSKLPAFQKFFNQHSELAGLFRLPSGDNAVANLQGLQTREQVMNELHQRFGRGAEFDQTVGQSMMNAEGQLDKIKNKVNQLGSANSDMDMPDFKPNQQKTKSFLQRLEFGSNFQSTKSNSFFPVTTDLGLSVGYKLNVKSTAGIGGSYKFGLGNDFRHIAFSNQGIGFRTFLDYKIKGNFWLSGGGEWNYRSSFKDLSILKDLTPWQQSLLLGVMKKFTIGKRMKAQMQLSFDFLYKQQRPQTQPIIFRYGYAL
jgi:CII-binding regulator of phage lambda lysogenization HflD